MPEDKPWLFATIPSLTRTTQVYTSRRSTADSPQEYKFTLEDIADFLVSEFGIQPIQGIYDDDVDAAAAGVAIGETYELSLGNSYGLPEGTLKIRRQ